MRVATGVGRCVMRRSAMGCMHADGATRAIRREWCTGRGVRGRRPSKTAIRVAGKKLSWFHLCSTRQKHIFFFCDACLWFSAFCYQGTRALLAKATPVWGDPRLGSCVRALPSSLPVLRTHLTAPRRLPSHCPIHIAIQNLNLIHFLFRIVAPRDTKPTPSESSTLTETLKAYTSFKPRNTQTQAINPTPYTMNPTPFARNPKS